MIKQLFAGLILLAILACSLTVFALSLAADQAIVTAADVAMQPDSAADLIIRSRTTGPEGRTSSAWLGAGLVALVLVGLGAVYIAMRGGTDFMKQLRLLKKKQRQRPQQRPYLPPALQPPYDEPPTMRPVHRLPTLPTWSDDDERR